MSQERNSTFNAVKAASGIGSGMRWMDFSVLWWRNSSNWGTRSAGFRGKICFIGRMTQSRREELYCRVLPPAQGLGELQYLTRYTPFMGRLLLWRRWSTLSARQRWAPRLPPRGTPGGVSSAVGIWLLLPIFAGNDELGFVVIQKVPGNNHLTVPRTGSPSLRGVNHSLRFLPPTLNSYILQGELTRGELGVKEGRLVVGPDWCGEYVGTTPFPGISSALLAFEIGWLNETQNCGGQTGFRPSNRRLFFCNAAEILVYIASPNNKTLTMSIQRRLFHGLYLTRTARGPRWHGLSRAEAFGW